MERDDQSGLFLPPGVGHNDPVVLPPSGCEFCDDALQKLGQPEVCGDCTEMIWRTRVPDVGMRYVQFEGHRFITVAIGDRTKRGHRVFTEIHTLERCRSLKIRNAKYPRVP